MKKNWTGKLLLTFAILPALLAQPALAHVVWFDYDNGEYNLLFGHPEESEPETIEPAKFQEATAYDKNKNIVNLEKIETEDSLSFVSLGDVAALTAFYDNGFWREYPDGSSENISQEEAEAISYENVTNFVKSTKGIYDWSEAISEPFGLPLEIVPLQNPFEVMPGENLPIQVLFENEVINTATVEYLGEELSVDENGTVLVPVGVGGLEVIEASFDNLTATNPGISYATTFSAEVAEESTSVPEPSTWLGLSLFGSIAFARKKRMKFKCKLTST